MNIPPPTEKQARLIWLAVTTLAAGVLLGMIGVLIWGLGQALNVLAPVLWPLAISGILAYLLDPVVDFFERRKVARGGAILLVFFICLAAVSAFFGSIVPQLVRETGRLVAEVPVYSKKLQEDLNAWMSRRPFFDEWRKFIPGSPGTNALVTNAPVEPAATNPPLPTEAGTTNQLALPSAKSPEHTWAAEASRRILGWLGETMPKVGGWFVAQLSRVASFAGTLVSLALVPVFTYYFLLEKKAIVESWTKYLPLTESQFKEELVFVINAINNYLIVFFRGQVVVALILGALLTVGFVAIGLNYAVLLGVMAGALSIVPYLGAVLTIVPAVTLAAVQFGDWLHPALVVGVFALVQMLEGLVISPRVMGERVGLHPLTIIVALLVGTTLLGGILGGILAIPLTAALRVLMFRYVWKRRGEANLKLP